MTEELVVKAIGPCEQCFEKKAEFAIIYRHVGYSRHYNSVRLMCLSCAKKWRQKTKFPTLHKWSSILVDC